MRSLHLNLDAPAFVLARGLVGVCRIQPPRLDLDATDSKASYPSVTAHYPRPYILNPKPLVKPLTPGQKSPRPKRLAGEAILALECRGKGGLGFGVFGVRIAVTKGIGW